MLNTKRCNNRVGLQNTYISLLLQLGWPHDNPFIFVSISPSVLRTEIRISHSKTARSLSLISCSWISFADPNDFCSDPDPLIKISNNKFFLLPSTFYSEMVSLKFRLFCFIQKICISLRIFSLYFKNVNFSKHIY